MNKILVSIILMSNILLHTITTHSHSVELEFYQMFEEHGSIMLLVDTKTGTIEHANRSASEFYGYTIEQLESMNMNQINILSEEEIERRVKKAESEKKSYYILDQKLSNGEIRTVEVNACPHTIEGKTILFVIINDITDKVNLEQKHKHTTYMLILILLIIISTTTVFSLILFKNIKKLKLKNQEIESFNELRKTFINSYDNLIYLKDENLKYVFVNSAMETLFGKQEADIVGHYDHELTDIVFADTIKISDKDVLENKRISITEVEYRNRIYKSIKFPVKLVNKEYGVGAYIEDITESYISKRLVIKNLYRNQILVDILGRNFESTQEQLDYVLNESLKLTESMFGYIYLYNEDTKEFTLNSWSKEVMKECLVVEKQTKYKLEKTGIWGEVVRTRKPIIVNDYEAPDIRKKGYPKGHVKLSKFMSIPVIIDGKIVAIVGLANKKQDYDNNDIYQITALMNGIWIAKERREVLVELAVERNKFLQTLISMGDGVMVTDLNNNVTMLNKVAEKLTGWTNEEAKGNPYKDVFDLSNEANNYVIDPIEEVIRTDKTIEINNNYILTSRNGTQYHIEDSASPVKDDKDNTIGVVLVFRDVTEKNEQIKKIEFLSYNDALAGLHNRMSIETELKRLDTEKNLPLSVIVGDVNGLKMTNDIFGHKAGDELLIKVADVFKRVCRENDIIARVGGDEFTILLPKTSKGEAEEIISRVRHMFSLEKVQAIKGSISMGCDTKIDKNEDILHMLKNAEEQMYAVKTLDRKDVKSTTLKTIIDTLHNISPKYKEHAINVSILCEKIGNAIGLSKDEIIRVKEAGYLHDIGKIILSEKILRNEGEMSENEEKQYKQHPVTGYRILNLVDEYISLAEIALYHHEKWDGTGYPKGLKGDQIPKLSRIVAIADSYNNLILNGASHDESLIALQKLASVEYDPEIVNKLLTGGYI